MALKAGPGGPAATRGFFGRGVRGRVFRDVASALRRGGAPRSAGVRGPRFGFGRIGGFRAFAAGRATVDLELVRTGGIRLFN